MPRTPARPDEAWSSPARVVCWYLAFGAVWIVATDYLLTTTGDQTWPGFLAAVGKGGLFLGLSGAWVYLCVRRELDRTVRTASLLEAVVEGTTDAVYAKDESGRYLLFNGAAARLVGKPVAEVLGRDDTALFDQAGAAGVMYRDRRVMRTGMPDTVEEILTAGGVTRTYHATKAPYRNPGGRVIGVIGISRDITDRVTTEAALREGEQKFRELADSIPQMVWTTTADGTLDYLNARALQYIGVGLEWVSGWSWEQVIHPDDAPRTVKQWREAHRTGVARPAEVRIRRSDGEYRWFVSQKTPGRAGDGTVVRWYGTFTDIHDQKQTEAALRASEETFRSLADSTQLLVWMAGLDGSCVYFNRAWLAFTGRPLEEELGGGWAASAHPADRDRCLKVYADRFAARSPFEMEYRLRHHDGTYRWVLNTGSPRHGPGGEFVGFVGSCLDITDRKQTETALRASEERYRRLVDVLPTALFVKRRGKILFCNRAFLALVGADTPDQIVGRDPLTFFPPEAHDEFRRRIVTMRATGQPAPGGEETVVRLDGRPVRTFFVATPVPGDNENDGIIVVLSDLTDRERSLGLLRAVMASVADAIVTIDARGTVQSVNPATERMFGYAPEELIGRNVNVLTPEPHRTQHDEYLSRYLTTNVAKVIGIGRELEARRKDGSIFPIDLTVTEFLMDGGRHFAGVIRDVTARKRLEDQYRQAQKMEAIGQLAGGVAHDFNNLLTVINGYCELLLGQYPADDPRTQLIEEVAAAGKRAAGLTAQLLAFSRKTIIEPKVLNLNVLIEHFSAMLHRLIGEDVELVLRMAAVPERVRADPGHVEQVLMNLIVNARDAMPGGGRVTIESAAVTIDPADGNTASDLHPGRYVRLRVSDTGGGMSPEVRDRVFEPFFTTKGAGRGTGLGLATVYGTVKQAGGHIAVDSAPGRGTTFTIWYPAVPDALPAQTPEAPARAEYTGTETILVAEDEREVRRLIIRVLKAAGYTVIAAESGREVLAAAAAHPHPIHLLVTDVIMPGMSGRQLADALREVRPEARVLYMSGYTDDAILRHGVERSFVAFLQKPFTPVALARKVRMTLDGVNSYTDHDA